MSLAEIKAAVIEKVAAAENESEIREVLEHLNELTVTGAQRLNLSQHYDTVASQYGDALQRLAQ